MRALTLLLTLLTTSLAAGCSCESFERDAGPMEAGADACAACETCQDTVRIRITAAGLTADQVSISGAALSCRDAGSEIYCSSRSIAPGMYELTISAPGYMDQQIFFDLDPPLNPDDCCSCPGTFSQLVTLSMD